jgi:hypothetical protein
VKNNFWSALAFLVLLAVAAGCSGLPGDVPQQMALMPSISPLSPEPVASAPSRSAEAQAACNRIVNLAERIQCFDVEAKRLVREVDEALALSIFPPEPVVVVNEPIVIAPPSRACQPKKSSVKPTPALPKCEVVQAPPPAPAIALPAPAASQPTSGLGLVSELEYEGGWLVYDPWWSTGQKVQMTEQTLVQGYECPAFVEGQPHRLTIQVEYAVKPTRRVEREFYRFVAIYAGLADARASKNVVTHADIKAGVLTYLGQHREVLCSALEGKSLSEVRLGNWLGWAKQVTAWAASDDNGYFEVTVQSTKVDVPQVLKDWLVQKGVEATTKPPCSPAKRTPACST